MSELREQLRDLIDRLPNQALERAKAALAFCADPDRQNMTIERAKRRARELSEQQLRQHMERTGHGIMLAFGSGGGRTLPDGTHHTSMIAFENGKDATYHLYMYRGTEFEIIETIETSEDGRRLIRRERIKGVDGKEQLLTAELPALPPIENSPKP